MWQDEGWERGFVWGKEGPNEEIFQSLLEDAETSAGIPATHWGAMGLLWICMINFTKST